MASLAPGCPHNPSAAGRLASTLERPADPDLHIHDIADPAAPARPNRLGTGLKSFRGSDYIINAGARRPAPAERRRVMSQGGLTHGFIFCRTNVSSANAQANRSDSRCGGYRSDLATMKQGIRNANDGLSDLQIKDGALGNISTLLDRLSTLATQSASGSTSAGSRTTLDAEFQDVLTEITRESTVAGLSSSNGFSVFLATRRLPRAWSGTIRSDISTLGIWPGITTQAGATAGLDHPGGHRHLGTARAGQRSKPALLCDFARELAIDEQHGGGRPASVTRTSPSRRT